MRGLEKVNGEWHLFAATHNLLSPQASPQE